MTNYGEKQRFNRDCDPRMTLGDMVAQMVDAYNSGGEREFYDCADDLFLDGCYGHNFDVLAERGNCREMRRDIRGALLAMYQAGRVAGRGVKAPDADALLRIAEEHWEQLKADWRSELKP